MGENCKHKNCRSECHVISYAKPRTQLTRSPIKHATTQKRQYPKPKPKSAEERAYAEELKVFFDEMMEVNEPLCENCGSYRPHLKAPWYKFLWKSCQSHLLEKKNFKSIATHPLNIMVMGSGISGMCWCHDNYGSSWHKASQMRIWPEVCRRFKILYPLIHPSEHKFIPKELLNEL